MQLNEKYDDRPGTAGERIIAILGGAELERAWKECLAVWENSSPAQRADCRAFVVHLRDGFVRVLRDVDDAQEQETIAAIFYMQVKAQWILINTQSGYQIQNGRMDGALFCRAAMLSGLLGALEPVLRGPDLARITNFLAEPTGSEAVSSGDVSRLESLLGADVVASDNLADGSPSGMVIVDAHALQGRLQQLTTRLDESEREWRELESDLGVSGRDGISDMFRRLHLVPTEGAAGAETDTEPDDAPTRAARAEWAAQRETQLRALRHELGAISADWERVRVETGASDPATLIISWRHVLDSLGTAHKEITRERATLATLRAEYGDAVTGERIIGEIRRLSSLVAEQQTRAEAARAENEYLEREFGTVVASQMVALVRGLRDRVTELSAKEADEETNRAGLVRAFDTTDADEIACKIRAARDQLAVTAKEMVSLRADRYVFQNELGKTDAREIVAMIHSLERRVEGYREMSDLLDSMDQALKTLNS